MSLLGLCMASFMHFQVIDKPMKPLTATIEGRIISRSEVKADRYIQDAVEDEDWINVEVTFYDNCKKCTGSGKGITASGEKTHLGVVAIPKQYKLGTKFFIPELKDVKSDGTFVGLDRGGAIKMKGSTVKLDIWVENHEKALKLGIRHLKAKIIN